jgi:hypothetical protein
MVRYAMLAGVAAVALTGCSSASAPPAPTATPLAQQSPTPTPSPTPTVPMTPQQQYINDLKSQYPGYASQLPDPAYSSSNMEVGTDAAILDQGAQVCEALGSGGMGNATNLIQQYDSTNMSNGQEISVARLTRADLCPHPVRYRSRYQAFDNALKAAGVYGIVISADSTYGDPYQFAYNSICGGDNGISPSWDQGINMTQAQANVITRITDKYVCPGSTSPVTLETVTFMATGSSILYGPAGSENSGTSGMKLTEQIPPGNPPAYYAISVFGGSCKLTVLNSDGTTTTSQASGSGMAACELVYVGGTWYDANTG